MSLDELAELAAGFLGCETDESGKSLVIRSGNGVKYPTAQAATGPRTKKIDSVAFDFLDDFDVVLFLDGIGECRVA